MENISGKYQFLKWKVKNITVKYPGVRENILKVKNITVKYHTKWKILFRVSNYYNFIIRFITSKRLFLFSTFKLFGDAW